MSSSFSFFSTTATSTISSSSNTREKHDVFISFRGSDVRVGFLSHFLKALAEKNVDAFVDEELERGEEISSSLLEIIEGSSISIVIFSENYADSGWCLDELVKIAECKKRSGQIVIPVFYGLYPTLVRNLTGSFGHALSKHRQEIKYSNKVENWCQALKETSNLSGFVSSNFKSESKLIEEIIRRILEKLNQLYPSDCSYEDGLVGIDSRIKNVMSLLCREDVRVVGIWGEGGIGKTTLARKVYEQISGQFESHCFVANVRERYGNRPDILQNQLHSKLLGEERSDMGNYMMVSSFKRRRLSRKKLLIVLDDVSAFDPIKPVIGRPVDYGSGSRIIVTSRNKQLLKNFDAEIYEVEKLNECEALQLFCLHAFKQNNIPQEEEFWALSRRAVRYAQGLPLVLKVLGCNLHMKSVEQWKDALEYLKGASDGEINKILRWSYDGLSEVEKEITVVIACLFRGKRRDYVESMLDDPGSKFGISRLVDMSLISISSKNHIHMHDLIQQMAKEIFCEEKKIKKRSILWNPDEIYYMLTEEKGTGAIKGISLDMSKIREINLSPKAFERMYNLRYLKFHDSSYSNNIKVHLPQGLEFLSDELRYFYWYRYLSKSLPWSFCAEKLVKLNMPYSHLEELWNGVQNLANLKLIDLNNSKKLIKIPDLSAALNLEVLDLSFCTSLVEISSSVKYLSKLTALILDCCTSLCRLPSCLHLISLEYFNLGGCSELAEIPNIPCYERHPRNAIDKAPSSFGFHFQLRYLDIYGCPRLESLPDSICNLMYLRVLSIKYCVNLCQLPQNLGNLKSLEELTANRSGIHQLPDSICSLINLKMLHIDGCVNLCQLPQNLGNLKNLGVLTACGSGIKDVPSSINCLWKLSHLNLEGCGILDFPNSVCSLTSLQYLNLAGNHFESIPESIKQLSRLCILVLRDCKRLKHLPELPKSLTWLLARNCTSLESVSLESSLVTQLDFGNCINLDGKQRSKIIDHILLEQLNTDWSELIIPGSEVPQKMKYQNKSGSSLSFSFQLQQQTDSLWFCLFALLDPQVCEFCDGKIRVRCQFDIIGKKSNCCIASGKSGFYGECAIYQSKHMLIATGDGFFNKFVKGHEYTVVFNFSAIEIIHYDEGRRSNDAIIECGVHPRFDYVLID